MPLDSTTASTRGSGRGLAAALLLAAAGAATAAAQSGPAGYVHFRWEQAGDGIWLGVTPPDSFISGNTVIIAIPPEGALVVDPHITEFTAREIIAKAREVAGPVKYLVNTHLHNDHTQGNTAFKKAFPDVEIIAHRNTCWGVAEKAVGRSRYRLGKLAREVDEIRANMARVSDPKLKAGLARIIAGNELYLEDAATLQWTHPTTCLDLEAGEARTVRVGDREIQIRYFGRAHTAGDLVVYLPRERMLANGDLWMSQGGGGGDGRDGSILEAPGTLRAIAALDFDVVLPGHGDLFRGKDALNKAIANVERLIEEVKAAYGRGEYIEQVLAALAPPPPASSGPPTVASYVPYMSGPANAARMRAVVRAFEELELLKQRGLPLP